MEGGGRAPDREARGRRVPWTPPRSLRPPMRAPLAGVGGPSPRAPTAAAVGPAQIRRPPLWPRAEEAGRRSAAAAELEPGRHALRGRSRAACRSSRGGPQAGEPRRRRTPARAELARPHAVARRTGRAEAAARHSPG
ncbi:hypothetical protein PVAP13_9KG195185 [Panicum virgatum]|uniref:Uncharacterized protein n=1 Tax=Panicum virgatum TaxID=38727 RepID=A0A8T0NGS2_PANVG|nr:hypothetical protein PVAP13_9KG195185 [Panicum virgatum]